MVGGGYTGLYATLALLRNVPRGTAQVTLVTQQSFMVYQPFLPEAASGNIEPRHVTIPLRTVLRGSRLIVGAVTAIDHDRRIATIRPVEGSPFALAYDHAVIGVGSVSRVLPVPGLAEHAIGFKSVAEAIYLRNQVLSCMDVAESTRDPAIRSRALTFVFVGGGYSGVEAFAELEDLARDACRYYRTIHPDDMRWILVEASDGILPELSSRLGEYAMRHLRRRGAEVHVETRLESAEGGHLVLSNGMRMDAETLVWTTGVRAHPLTGTLGFPTDERGRILTDACLRVRGVEGAWAAGDCAATPDLDEGGTFPPTAQHALREARRLGRNLAAHLKGEPVEELRYRNKGLLVSLGRYKGVALVMGIRVRGFPAWVLHRSYHLLMIPTVNRRVRIALDWTVGLLFRRDVVQLGSLRDPGAPMQEARGTADPATGRPRPRP